MGNLRGFISSRRDVNESLRFLAQVEEFVCGHSRSIKKEPICYCHSPDGSGKPHCAAGLSVRERWSVQVLGDGSIAEPRPRHRGDR